MYAIEVLVNKPNCCLLQAKPDYFGLIMAKQIWQGDVEVYETRYIETGDWHNNIGAGDWHNYTFRVIACGIIKAHEEVCASVRRQFPHRRYKVIGLAVNYGKAD